MLTLALQIQCPKAGNALHVLTLDGNDRTLGLPHNALPTSQTDRGYTTAPNSNRPGSSCSAAPASIALMQPQTLIGNEGSLTGIIPRPPSKVANIPSAKTTNRQRSLRESTRTHSTNKSTEMAVSRQTRSNRIIQSAKPSTVAIKPFPSEVVPSVSPQSNFNPTSKIHRQTIAGSLMVSPSQMSHEMPQVLSSRDTPLVISTNEYKSAPRSLEKDRPLSSRHRNSYPLGAHTAGFYSKHRSSTIHSGINVPTVNAMLRDMDLLSQSRVQQRDQVIISIKQPTYSNKYGVVTWPRIHVHRGVYTGIGFEHEKRVTLCSMIPTYIFKCCVEMGQPNSTALRLFLGRLLGQMSSPTLTSRPHPLSLTTRLSRTLIISREADHACNGQQTIVQESSYCTLALRAYLEMKIRTDRAPHTGELPKTSCCDFIIVNFCWKSSSCISLDLSLDDAVEHCHDASRLVTVNGFSFILSTAKQRAGCLRSPLYEYGPCEREVMGKANFPTWLWYCWTRSTNRKAGLCPRSTTSECSTRILITVAETRSVAHCICIPICTEDGTPFGVLEWSAKDLLSADRCTLFLNDNEQKQLLALIQGRDSLQEIRIPRNAGIAGAVFMSGQPINIPDAYKDERFNPAVDEQTGYRTRNILCMPIKNIHGESIGVTQMINKKTGAFTIEDEKILSSFSAQAAVALEKSQLFKKTKDMRIYLQSILSSITSCVITLTESMRMHTFNRPLLMNALGITEEFMRENPCNKWIGQENISILNDILRVFSDGQAIYVADYEIKGASTTIIVNYQVMPLIGSKGVVIVFDDISSERHAVMTLGRYMSPALAKQVMQDNGQLGGKRKKVSILFQ
ncbi:hypothetical protein BASA62_006710 [Batrachochytrium salamandrivorans]|nr:hypothetical protein BASA62_006710 [Batrachochytrium salamandrivorans]